MPTKNPEQIPVISTTEGRRNPILKAVTDAPIPQTPDASVPSLTDAPELSPSNSDVISTGGRNPQLSAATPESSSNPVVISKDPPQADSTEKSHFPAQVSNSTVISNPALAGEKSPNKARHFRVTNSDVFYKGKSYPEGSIVDFQDDHLNKYLVPIIDDDITKDDTVYDTALTPVSTDTSLDPKYVASRRRGRPRQL